MDPTATLAVLRELVAQVETMQIEKDTLIQLADSAIELATYVDALDSWITRGGHLPQQWRYAGGRER